MDKREDNDVGNWHQLSAHELLAHFKSDPTRVLSKAEASRRSMEYGPNELRAAGRISPWAILFEQFKNILTVNLNLRCCPFGIPRS